MLDRNWRRGRYELDLIVRRRGLVAFVEVKTRRSSVEPSASALVPAQRRRIRRAAEAWIHAHPGLGEEFRFDLVTVDLDPDSSRRVRHFPEAFYGDEAW
ncbi:MAG: YraN family protein [Gemmatimonadetes bacterium]|nr:YraN family protein [Gemmatimonadota bacterium]